MRLSGGPEAAVRSIQLLLASAEAAGVLESISYHIAVEVYVGCGLGAWRLWRLAATDASESPLAGHLEANSWRLTATCFVDRMWRAMVSDLELNRSCLPQLHTLWTDKPTRPTFIEIHLTQRYFKRNYFKRRSLGLRSCWSRWSWWPLRRMGAQMTDRAALSGTSNLPWTYCMWTLDRLQLIFHKIQTKSTMIMLICFYVRL